MQMRLKIILKVLFLTFFPLSAFAGKVDALFGVYSASGSGAGKNTNLSGVGATEFSYLIPFRENYELTLGYCYIVFGGITSDFGYGPKVGINYFPFNFSSNEKILIPDMTIEDKDFFKPYLGASFNQVQYVSNKTSFAGFGVSAGFEKYLSPKYTLKSEVKYKMYTGSSDSRLNEINFLTGLVINF